MGNNNQTKQKSLITVDNSNLFFPVLYQEFPNPPRFQLIKEFNLSNYNVKNVLVLNDGNILVTTKTKGKLFIILDKANFNEILCINSDKNIAFDVEQLDNGNIVAFLSNGKVNVYSIKNNAVNKLKEIDVIGGIMQKILDNSIVLYSIKENGFNIKIYDLSSLNDIKEKEIICKDKIDSILQPKSNKDILVVAHSNYIITFYNIKDCTKIDKNISSKEYFTSSLFELNDGRVIIGGNASFMIVNCITYQFECFTEDLFCFENCSFLQMNDKSILIGTGLSNAGRFCLLGSNLDVIARQKRVHKDKIVYLYLIDDNTVLSYSLDQFVKIWKYNQ